ncbi:MAG: ABC transporter ATP-binding protein [Coriobacteriales bacterium]|nr:ABC transporter ATP-binding protein [Coriobacteriales bacterium]
MVAQDCPNIIEFRHVSKSFSDVAVLKDINLTVRRGEIFALLGENGSGKSLLMNMVFGGCQPDSGEILICGEPVQISSSAEAFAHGIGMVSQHYSLISNATVLENVILGHEPTRRLMRLIPYLDTSKAARKVQELCNRYGLNLSLYDRIDYLSEASQQRVEILKMLYRDSELIILDEPTAMLAPQEAERLLAIVRKLQDDGRTVILISHRLEDVKQVADRCAVLRQGRLTGVFKVFATSTRRLAERMVGHALDFELERQPAVFGDVVLSVRNLCVEYSENKSTLHDISFDVRAGEVFAVIGVAGSGESALADAIAGLAPADSGSIRLMDRDITQDSVRARSLAGMAYIPDDRRNKGLFVGLPISDNLVTKSYFQPPYSKGAFLQRGEFRRYAVQFLKRYGLQLAKGIYTPTYQMSDSEQQMLIIGRETDLDARLIIFSKPTQGLDIGTTLEIRRRVVAERDQGKAVLLTTNELDGALACADTIAIIHDGAFVKVGPANEMSRQELGEYMMGVHR